MLRSSQPNKENGWLWLFQKAGGARLRSVEGAAMLEVCVAAALLTLIVVSSTYALLVANRHAASVRLATAARAVVQRNIDEALSLGFNSDSIPPILAVANNVVHDDDGANDGKVRLSVQENGTTVQTQGELRRTVTKLTNANSADIRQITFRLTYKFRGRNQTVEMTTVRAIDD